MIIIITQNQVIEFTLDNTESIQKGLKKYQELLKNDLVNLHNQMDVIFTYKEDNQLKPLQGYHGEESYLKDLEKISMITYTQAKSNFQNLSSEGIFFSHALKYSELFNDVIDTAKEIVNYSRRHNDTWMMWADDVSIFGLDALYLIAKKYPEYTYLIGGFIIPYWDNEHAPYAFDYLLQLYKDNGFSDDLMKAFCYCDSDEGRLAMLGLSYNFNIDNPFNLYEYFKDNLDKYELFKTLLKERYEKQRFLQYSKNDYTDRPIEKIYKVIIASLNEEANIYDDEDNILEEFFIEDTYDNEAFILQEKIEKELNISLVDDVIKSTNKIYENEIWEDFFINGFENGDNIWNYILFGDNIEALENLNFTDIRALSKEKKLIFYKKKIKYFMDEDEKFNQSFHLIFQGFIDEYFKDISQKHIIIRALKVFYILNNKDSFSPELFNLIISNNIMSHEEFIKDFDLSDSFKIENLSYLLSGPMNSLQFLTKYDIKRIYKYMEVNRSEIHSLFENKETLSLKTISLAIFLLEQDFLNKVSDKTTLFLIEFIEKHWLNLFTETLEKRSTLTIDDLEKIKNYIAKNNNSSIISSEEIIKLLKEKLKVSRGSKYSSTLKYKIFNNTFDHTLIDIIPAFYFGGYKLNLSFSKKFQTSLNLLLSIDSLKIIENLYDINTAHMENYSIESFRVDMKNICIDNPTILAVEIRKAEDDSYIDMYYKANKNNTKDEVKSYSQKDFEMALSHLNKNEYESFLQQIEKKYPGNTDYFSDFIKEIEEFVKSNLNNSLYENKKSQNKLEKETFKLIIDYLDGKDILYKIVSNLTLSFTNDSFTNILWKIDEKHRDRFLSIFAQMGSKGINCGISNTILKNKITTLNSYLEKMITLGSKNEEILQWGIEWQIKEALLIANKNIDIFPFINNLSLNQRELVVNLSKEIPEMKKFIIKMTEDKSLRIRKIAKNSL